MGGNEILVVPKNGQGHLIPSMELCKHLLSRDLKVTVLIDADISSSVPTSLRASPLFSLAVLSSRESLHAFLSGRRPPGPACAVIDHVKSRDQQVFANFGIPTVVFITSGAAWAAVQHAVWKVRPADMKPGETRALPGLPRDVVLSYADLHQRLHWLPPPMRTPGAAPIHRMGPPLPGEPAPWVEEVSASAAILINTCDSLERPFLDYVADLTRKPVFAVGPLLPDQYWLSLRSDREIRPQRDSNYTHDEVLRWLDAKPCGSVTYVSFGSEVGPSTEEYPLLADALEGSARPFIWVIQRKKEPGTASGPRVSGEEHYFPHGLASKVAGERGLIIHGWAPQLLILSHPATAGFVSHCGWNSTVEAVARGVPVLAWPIRGDQYYNAKLVVSFLKVGTLVAEGYPADMVKREDIMQGIERLVTDEGIRSRAAALQAKFDCGFPGTSVASLDAFKDFFSPIKGAGGCSA